jgi:hypothetical protein
VSQASTQQLAPSQQPVAPQQFVQQPAIQQQSTSQPSVASGTVVQTSTAQPGYGFRQQQNANVESQQLTGKGAAGIVDGVDNTVKQGSLLQGSSSVAVPNEVRTENSVSELAYTGTAAMTQKTATAKVCRRCGAKGHLMSECTALVFCEICRSSDHAMCRCPVLKQPKPVAHLVGQAADALAGFFYPTCTNSTDKEGFEDGSHIDFW